MYNGIIRHSNCKCLLEMCKKLNVHVQNCLNFILRPCLPLSAFSCLFLSVNARFFPINVQLYFIAFIQTTSIFVFLLTILLIPSLTVSTRYFFLPKKSTNAKQCITLLVLPFCCFTAGWCADWKVARSLGFPTAPS